MNDENIIENDNVNKKYKKIINEKKIDKINKMI